MTESIKKRVNYTVEEDALKVSFGDSEMTLPVPEEVQSKLAAVGLRTILQQRTMKAAEGDKLAAIGEAYEQFVEEGEAAFERKSPVGRKVQFKKVDKVMALALVKGVTVTAVQEALSGLDPDKQRKILNSQAVLDKLHQMQEEIDLGD